MSTERFRAWVLDALRLASASPAEQLEYLSRSGLAPDEIILQIDDLVIAARARRRDGEIGDAELSLIEQVALQASDVETGGVEVWSSEGLRESELWDSLRGVAKNALNGVEREWSTGDG